MIGSVSHPIPLSAVSPIAPATTASDYFGYSFPGGYFIADSLLPGKGYWIKMSQSGSLVLGPGPAGVPRASAELSGGADRARTAGDETLIFRDASRAIRKFFVSTDPAQTGGVAAPELPPKAPGESFDVRDPLTQRSGAAITGPGGTIPIEITTTGGTIGLEWDFERSHVACDLLIAGAAGPVPYRLEGKGSLDIPVFSDVTRASIAVHAPTPRGESDPREVALDQNFPNPFNPSTRITYFLPVRSTVRLTVFDVLGRSVASLAAGEEGQGYHTVSWDATGVSSGVYFCRLDVSDPAGSSRRTIKMFLIR
jgi:hypothetical protein